MRKLTPALASAVILAAAGAHAQSPEHAPSTPPGQPAAQKPGTTVPEAAKQRKAATASATQSLVGKDAFSSDGTRVGDVRAVKTAPDGRITALLVKTGGFLGFGGRIVEVPEGRFKPSNQDVRLDMTADEASKLPEVKDGT